MIQLETVNKKAALRPANLFFVELIIVLLFFSFSAAVILQVFAAADKRQRVSDLTEQAIICAQSLAEAYSVTGSADEAVSLTFGGEIRAEDGRLLLDEGFKPSGDDVALTLRENAQVSDAGTLSQLQMSFALADGEELYSAICYAYIPNGGGGDE